MIEQIVGSVVFMDRLVVKRRECGFCLKAKAFDSDYAAQQRALEKLYEYEDSLLEPSEVKKLIEENERNRRTIISLAEGKINCIEALQAECRRAADDLF